MKTNLKQSAETIRKFNPAFLSGTLSMNEILVETYKAETGCTQFKTFKTWRELGYKIKKGSKGFPIFSRPIGVIKEEKGKQASEDEFKYFGTCYLFNESQVENSF